MATKVVGRQTRMYGERLAAYQRALSESVAAHAINERLELSRFRDRDLTNAEWELLNGAFTRLREQPVPAEISLAALWPRILPTMERGRFRVLEDPPPNNNLIDYVTVDDGVFALCRGEAYLSQPNVPLSFAVLAVHNEACRLALMEGLGLDRATFAFVTGNHLQLREPFALFKAAMAMLNTLILLGKVPKDQKQRVGAVNWCWQKAREVVEPQLHALARHPTCRRDAFYVPIGTFAGIQVTREMIECLLLGDTLSLEPAP